MVLVAYSDSEGSDNESSSPPKPSSQSIVPPRASQPSKLPAAKLVDRANPSKIIVNLPKGSSDSIGGGDNEKDGPPAKKQRTGSFGGFNAMLPAPKRTGVVGSGIVTGTSDSLGGTKRSLGKGLGIGVNLKTGAAPAFSREPMEASEYDETGNVMAKRIDVPKATPLVEEGTEVENDAQEVKLVGKPMIFKPLSVTNRAKKKKTAGTLAAASKSADFNTPISSSKHPVEDSSQTARKAKVSLFSAESEEFPQLMQSTTEEYQPLLHGTDSNIHAGGDSSLVSADDSHQAAQFNKSGSSLGPHTLDTVAADLQLTAAQRRQLFGRNAPKDLSTINLVNFNTDNEYAHNESLRAAGETVQHNPVRAIAPGKHSLQQLVNAAANQKDALEEHFASGRRNKKEAGSKYGW